MRNVFLLLTALAFTAPVPGQAQDSATDREYVIDSNASRLRVLAAPDGPLKRFGHHHVISHNGISGVVTVTPDPLESSIALELDVADFEVDDPALRALEGEDFEGEVPQKDIDGTRANMLGEDLLKAEQFPTIRIQSTAIEGSLPDVSIVATVTVTGIANTVTFPASIELTDDSLTASGELELTHAELGLSPFTAMGGALSVHETLLFKYEFSGLAAAESD